MRWARERGVSRGGSIYTHLTQYALAVSNSKAARSAGLTPSNMMIDEGTWTWCSGCCTVAWREAWAGDGPHRLQLLEAVRNGSCTLWGLWKLGSHTQAASRYST